MTDAVPVQVALVLDLPGETLTLALDSLSINKDHPAYSRELETSLWRFLIDYFKNGYLEVRESSSGRRLSYKTAFLSVNIDGRATLVGFQQRSDELESHRGQS